MPSRRRCLSSYPMPPRWPWPCVLVVLFIRNLRRVETEGNVLGRVQQLELDLQGKLREQLRSKLQLALDGAKQYSPEDSAGVAAAAGESKGEGSLGGVRVVKTGLMVPDADGLWNLLEGVDVDISESAPVCVLAPLRGREQLEELRSMEHVSARAMVSSRLLHAARMLRMARGVVRERLDLPSNSHKRSPPQPDDTRPTLLRVFCPEELADTLCLVAHDELHEYTFKPSCVTYSQAREARRKTKCSVAIWGTSTRDKHVGNSLAAAFTDPSVGIEVDLDQGDTTVPTSFPSSAIPGVYGTLGELPDDVPSQVGPAHGGPYTVVTAFSKNHYTVGLRLLNSILVEGRKSATKWPFSVVVWTMETFDPEAKEKVLCMVEQMRKAKISTVVKAFDFAKYPLWTYVRHYKAGWWAWKAIMVWETFAERGGSMLWIDGGNLVSGPDALPGTFKNLHKQGFVGVTDPWFGMNYRWTHPGTITFLGVDLGADTTQCCGCLFGVTPQTYESMLRPMYECSLTLQCLAPEGSNMANHRQDQSVLSVLAWHNRLPCTGANEELKFKCDSTRYHCSEPPLGGAAQICRVK